MTVGVVGWLADPFQYAFFARAVIAGVLVGAMCGALSVFVVLRRMSYIGHGLAHAVLGGVAVGVAVGADLYVGALAATVLAAVLIDRVTRRRELHADAAIGIVTTAIFAAGVAVIAVVPTPINLEAMLFGNILGVARTDLWVVSTVGLAFVVLVAALYKPLVFTTFDREVAAVHGVRVRAIELVLSLVTAAVVVASVRVLGVLLIAAAVVIPAATARLVTRSFGRLLLLATVLGTAFAVVGLYGSYYVDVPSGPAIVLTGAVTFTVTFLGTAAASRHRVRTARRETGTLPGVLVEAGAPPGPGSRVAPGTSPDGRRAG